MKTETQIFYFEYTDLFAGECNYCWLKKYAVKAKTIRGAVNILSRYIGGNFRYNGWSYDSVTSCSAYYEAFPESDEEMADFVKVNF